MDEQPQKREPQVRTDVSDDISTNLSEDSAAPSPVRVAVALDRPDWTGRHVLTEVTADDVLAAAQWDERCWRR